MPDMSRIKLMESNISLKEHLKNARKSVDPKNCARTSEQASAAAHASWGRDARKRRAVAAKARKWARENKAK